MKAVFEEVNGDLAVFIVEDVEKTYSLSIDHLPKNANPGDIFEATIGADDQLNLLKKLPNERRQREQSAQSKREALLKRTRQRNQKE